MTNIFFKSNLPAHNSLRQKIDEYYRQNETYCLKNLITHLKFGEEKQKAIESRARKLVTQIRQQEKHIKGVDALMQQYDLSTEEGIALMCLAEALLRIPDNATADQLIKDKVADLNFEQYLGQSHSTFVNATTWGLLLTGKIMHENELPSQTLSQTLKKLLEKSSAPLIRRLINQAMKVMAKQFVIGRNIEEALIRSQKGASKGYTYSFDMLGEAARTLKDAERYFESYKRAIFAVGKNQSGADITKNPGISVKLSALHPRYEFTQQEIVVPFLVGKLKELCLLAKKFNIGLTIDAEEADRLDISLDIFERVYRDPDLDNWNGFGLALQSYQKRAFYVIDWLVELYQSVGRRICLRLIKGAYWDYEIKDTQVRGLKDYPVFTRKAATDVSFLACANKLAQLDSQIFYCQFGTHNAYSVAAIIEMMGARNDYEFQCLKGMGGALYDQILADKNAGFSCRMYAPVGEHEDLLPYLVRRLLENGANTSFVNRIFDRQANIEELIQNPLEIIKKYEYTTHPKIPLPINLYAPFRRNSQGLDFSDYLERGLLQKNVEKFFTHYWDFSHASEKKHEILNPANHQDRVGAVNFVSEQEIENALSEASRSQFSWDQLGAEKRAAILEKIADSFETARDELIALLVREAGKTFFDALGEVREAADFCRYYAEQAKKQLITKILPGPTGEHNELQMHGRGVVFCISPWNFPLAIFTGQIVAALVSGNTVLAKPAEQTSLIAFRAIQLMHQAGVPKEVLHLLPGEGSRIGRKVISDKRIKAVMLTGSTETAQIINRQIAVRDGEIIPLIAETGGQNAMIADSTALPEQMLVDVMSSAFGSAGQRCSALRVLFLQEEIAERFIEILKGAMAQLIIDDPKYLSTDIGPVIDEEAKEKLEAHIKKISTQGNLISQAKLNSGNGTFVAPTAVEISDLSLLKQEIFGPVLHIIRYKKNELNAIIDQINATGFGLTLGVQTRIKSFADEIQQRIHAGNCYVNRNMIGAVVGVQPFGGEGLSGTGPKAGGPHYLARLCVERAYTINTTASGGNASLMALSGSE